LWMVRSSRTSRNSWICQRLKHHQAGGFLDARLRLPRSAWFNQVHPSSSIHGHLQLRHCDSRRLRTSMSFCLTAIRGGDHGLLLCCQRHSSTPPQFSYTTRTARMRCPPPPHPSHRHPGIAKMITMTTTCLGDARPLLATAVLLLAGMKPRVKCRRTHLSLACKGFPLRRQLRMLPLQLCKDLLLSGGRPVSLPAPPPLPPQERRQLWPQ